MASFAGLTNCSESGMAYNPLSKRLATHEKICQFNYIQCYKNKNRR